MIKHWKYIKEHRDNYISTYHPANAMDIALVNIKYIDETIIPDVDGIKKDIVSEGRYWVKRYKLPILVMVSGPDRVSISALNKEELAYTISPSPDSDEYTEDWGLNAEEIIPDSFKKPEYKEGVYSELEFVTKEEILESELEQKRIVRTANFIAVLWAVIPIVIAVFGYFNWLLVGLVALVISFYKGVRKLLLLNGVIKRSPEEIRRNTIESEKEHYYYHCKKNPDGFRKILIENHKNENIEKTQKESEELRRKV